MTVNGPILDPNCHDEYPPAESLRDLEEASVPTLYSLLNAKDCAVPYLQKRSLEAETLQTMVSIITHFILRYLSQSRARSHPDLATRWNTPLPLGVRNHQIEPG